MPELGQYASSLEAALAYHHAGFVVIPCCWPDDNGKCACGRNHKDRDVGKAPLIPQWESAMPNEDNIRFWFETRWPNANVGIVESSSGVVVVDTDSPDAYAEAIALGMDDTIIRVSKNPAFLFRRPEGCNITNATRKGESGKIDLLANGQIIAWGKHREGQAIYLQGAGLALAPQWAVDMLNKSNGHKPAEATSLPAELPNPDVDALGVTDRIREMITQGREQGERSEAIGAVAEALIGLGYDDATVAGVIWHNPIGEKAREQGLKWLAGDIARARVHVAETNAKLPTLRVSPPIPEEWEPPIPFYQSSLPAFPAHCLPEPLRAFVLALAESSQTPRDLAAVLTLAAVATTVQRKCEIKLGPDWKEPLNIYVAGILPSGSRKTTVISAVIAPIEYYEVEETLRTRAVVASAEAERKMIEQRITELQRSAARAEGDKLDSYKEEIKTLAAELAENKLPVVPRYFADDVTPEKLTDMLSEQNGRMAVFSAEGKIFDLMTGRYSQVPNFDVFLSAHCAETIRVDRLGRKGNYVTKPALTLGLAVQPDVIRGLMQTPTLRGRGLLARFLYVWPESMLGSRKIDPQPMPDDVKAAYSDMLLSLCDIPAEVDNIGQARPHILTLGEWATKSFREFQAWLEPQLSYDGALGNIADWAGKLAGLVARIAALLHLAEHADEATPWSIPISGPTMDAAIEIGHYAIAHARGTFAEMGADQEVEDAKHILRWIQREERKTFTKREANLALKGHFGTVAAMEPGLALLVSQGYLRQRQPERQSEKGRRPGPAYDVNPYVARR